MFASCICHLCGEPAELEIFEVWGHDFQLWTCCEGAYEEAVSCLNESPNEALGLLHKLDAEELVGQQLRRVIDDGGHIVLDYALEIRPISFSAACAFVREHHRHNKPPQGWRFGASVWNGPTMLGLVVCGRPVGRWSNAQLILEVTRLCLDFNLSTTLRWKAASTLYSWAAAEALRRGFLRIVTYTRVDESAMSLRYSKWRPVAKIRGRHWDTPSRRRFDACEIVDRIRWEKSLKQHG